MTALTKGRVTPEQVGDHRDGGVADGETIYQGGIVARNAAGYLVAAATAVGLVGVGRADEMAVNNSGSDGEVTLRYKRGCFRYANSAGADEITTADIGEIAFIVDDQTVALTDDTGARSPAGTIDGVDGLGVWVRFDETLTKAASA